MLTSSNAQKGGECLESWPDKHRKKVLQILDAVEQEYQKREKLHEENVDRQKNENLRLVEELSRVKALYDTRPLLELGLTPYVEKNPNLRGGTWTCLSQSFLEEHVFRLNSDLLQQ